MWELVSHVGYREGWVARMAGRALPGCQPPPSAWNKAHVVGADRGAQALARLSWVPSRVRWVSSTTWKSTSPLLYRWLASLAADVR
jgi:hypothetical protein